jgi:serine/threonine-protein kinase
MQTFDCPHCHRVFDSNPGDDEVVLCPHCNSAVALPEKDLEPGTKIGGFEIIRLLGHGGMGNVYLANQISMNRPVALKLLLKSMTQDKESVKQFLNEARVSGQLNHRNIITAIDAGEIDETYYLVTNFIDGGDLEKKLEEEKIIPEKVALRIILKIADALQYAWESHGILHKDIKPGNIMLDAGGDAFLMDMGIAQFIGDAPSEDEHILGSPFFMSPEQTRGERLSWTSDLYSLGATLYNMVVGVPPYDANDVMKIIEMHSKAPFPLPSKRNKDAKVSKYTVMLLKKMMAKKPNERFDSWGGLKEAIKKTLKQIDSPSKTGSRAKAKATGQNKVPSQGKKKGKQIRRRRVVKQKSAGGGVFALLVAIILIAAAGGGAYFFYNKNRNDNARVYLQRAETYNNDHPGDYFTTINNFKVAAQNARGTLLEQRANDRLDQIEEEARKQEALILKYKECKKRISELISQKKYSKAIKLLRESTQGIKNKSILLEAKMYEKQLQSKRK